MLGQFIHHCEDSLTEFVFSHLLHLPSEIFWRIVRSACCYTGALPEDPGEIEDVEFRRKWDPRNTDNAIYVEPDLFIRFKNLDLIIEAKRWDSPPLQDRGQWSREQTAYKNEHGTSGYTVHMIAVGGLIKEHDDDTLDYPVHMCRWARLLTECQRMMAELERLKYRSSQMDAHTRILKDVVALFVAHGFHTGVWFVDVIKYMPRLSPDASAHIKLFRRIDFGLPKT